MIKQNDNKLIVVRLDKGYRNLYGTPKVHYRVHSNQSLDSIIFYNLIYIYIYIYIYTNIYKTLRYVSVQGSAVSGLQERNRTY
jgi:hypothetical protein